MKKDGQVCVCKKNVDLKRSGYCSYFEYACDDFGLGAGRNYIVEVFDLSGRKLCWFIHRQLKV